MDPVAAVAVAVGQVFEGVANIIVTAPRRIGRAVDLAREDLLAPLRPGELRPDNTALLVVVIGTVLLVGVIVYSATRK